MNITETASLFKCLGDETRLKLLSMLLDSDSYVELLASRLGLTVGTISHHLKRLEEEGLVKCSRSQFYMIYSLDRSRLGSLADLIPRVKDEVDGGERYQRQILTDFIRNGRLISIPSQLKKREIIWRELVGGLETDRDYTEREINEYIKRWHEDYCTIRREFISFGLMERRINPGGDLYRRVK